MSDEKAGKNWFARHVEEQAKRDITPFYERVGNGIGFVVILLILFFFIIHQTSSTGFFTSKFGPVEAFLFYAPAFFGLVITAAKIIFDHRNMLRPFDAFNSCLMTLAFIWLFVVFPFEFSHFGDILPYSIQYLFLWWLSNSAAKVIMVMMIIGTAGVTVYTAALYVLVRRELSKA